MSVYTTVSSAELSAFLQLYAVGELLDFTGIEAGIENTNYFVITTLGRFVLTIYEHHSADKIAQYLQLMQYISQHGVETSTPVADTKGNLLNLIANKPAALIERLPGKALNSSAVTLEHCGIIGDALARYHLTATTSKFLQPNKRAIDLEPDFTTALMTLLNDEDRKIFQNELDFQTTIDWQSLPAGIIHSDLFCDNTLFTYENNKPQLSGIIDLYMSSYDAFLYDLAVVANDWCTDSSGALIEKRWLSLLKAYHHIRELQTVEKQAWVAMLRTASLRFWILRLNARLNPREGDMVLQKNPNDFKIKLLLCLQSQQALLEAIHKI